MLFISCEKLFLWLISKLIKSQAGQQIITIHILLDIYRSKGNQTMKLGQLIEYNMKNIFLVKSYTKCGEEASLKPFYKNQN